MLSRINSNAIESIKSRRKYALELITGKNKSNQDSYAYVLFNKQAFEENKREIISNYVDVSKYGIVVLQGEGQPSAESDEKAQQIFYTEYLADNQA